jgi:hypothetical protein
MCAEGHSYVHSFYKVSHFRIESIKTVLYANIKRFNQSPIQVFQC